MHRTKRTNSNPKPMREAIGIKPGVDVVIELRDNEIVISKPKVDGNYTEYYTSTSVPKLKKHINIKDLILKEAKQACHISDSTFLFIP